MIPRCFNLTRLSLSKVLRLQRVITPAKMRLIINFALSTSMIIYFIDELGR